MNDTTGKPLAVVTGASSGIGRELAARFAEHGYDLVVAAEDERIESTAASLAGQAVQALPVRADLAAFDGVEELWQRIQGTGRVPEAVAINAGVGVAGDFTRDNDLADELRLIGLNTGAVHLARRVLPETVAAGRGGVFFASSIAATAPGPHYATYAASKAFLLSSVAGSMKNNAQVAAGRIMPETAKAATQARQTEPGSGS
jgi:short-subunit dehydrogenase